MLIGFEGSPGALALTDATSNVSGFGACASTAAGDTRDTSRPPQHESANVLSNFFPSRNEADLTTPDPKRTVSGEFVGQASG
jgi:hypothetical protein